MGRGPEGNESPRNKACRGGGANATPGHAPGGLRAEHGPSSAEVVGEDSSGGPVGLQVCVRSWFKRGSEGTNGRRKIRTAVFRGNGEGGKGMRCRLSETWGQGDL